MSIVLPFIVAITVVSCSRVGIHNMQILPSKDVIYLSHVPMFRTPHDYQLLTLVELISQDLGSVGEMLESLCVQKLTPDCLFTLVPETLDLDLLVSNQLTSFTGEIYAGNPEQQESPPKVCDVEVSISKVLVAHQLPYHVEQLNTTLALQYIFLPINQTEGFLTHLITENTDQQFDSLLRVSFQHLQEIETGKILLISVQNRENTFPTRLIEGENVNFSTSLLRNQISIQETDDMKKEASQSRVKIIKEFACLVGPGFEKQCN